MRQNTGEKGIGHPDPDDPPRRRSNNRRGHGTFANGRPSSAGRVGRESGEIRLEVVDSADAYEPGKFMDGLCLSGATVNTDEWCVYDCVGGRHDQIHVTVDHSWPRSTWAIDADGDGVREVHATRWRGLGRACGTSCGRSGGEQVAYRPVCGDVRVGPYHQGSFG